MAARLSALSARHGGFLAGICGGGRDVAVAPAGVITYFASWPGVVSPVNSAQLAASFRDASPQDLPNPMSTRIGTESVIALQPSRATISACSKFFTEKRQAVVHLQQRHDAGLVVDIAQPDLGLPRGIALNDRVQRLVAAGAAQLQAVPGMFRIGHAQPRLFNPARPGVLGPFHPGGLVEIEMPARAVEQHDVARCARRSSGKSRRALSRTAAWRRTWP